MGTIAVRFRGEEPAPGRLTDHGVAAALAESVRQWETAFILCTPRELRLHWANSAARDLLDQGRQLALSGGRLACADRRWQRSLDELGAAASGTAIVLPPVGDCEALVLRGRTMRAPGEPVLLGVTAYSLSDTGRFLLPDLRNVYELTPAEMRVLRCLMDGLTADGLAQALSITIETARTHIRRIYAKMGVSSREQLICLASRYRVP
ncbi:helix-turn-helix transcriptional regulator [Brevundimonas sp. 2R-24]|uniref:Helix-turn-helix transcriptional regulator n=1 Tax=Peiella sedimenti TaxID=3061083 RepID=A0ABT8SMG2_9CAUL|nr:helix-turn-helix transcriptional regulator [Caulobacteraceae bacterium XZ-24]